jgi:hypothetical protein
MVTLNRFDAYENLVNFGTKPLDANATRIYSSSNAHISEMVQNRAIYAQASPHSCAGFNRGFYFQTFLVEFAFSDDLEQLGQEPSMTSLDGIQGVKTVTNVDGKPLELPYYPCHILVNRTLFPPQRQREDEKTWLTVMTERRRAIAHELLYAKQYAEYYDIESDSLSRAISSPIASEEDELMCPTHLIERNLEMIEVEFGQSYLTAGNFVDGDATYLQTYNAVWLRDYAVSESVSQARTIEYLRTGVRSHVRDNADGLIGKISAITRKSKPTSQDFHDCLRNGNHVELDELCGEYVHLFNVEKRTIVHLFSRVLDSANGLVPRRVPRQQS